MDWKYKSRGGTWFIIWLLTVGIAVVGVYIIIQLSDRHPGISREKQNFSKTQADILAGHEKKPHEKALKPPVDKPKKTRDQKNNVETEQVSSEKVSVISTSPKEGIYNIPPTISVNFSFPTMKVIMALLGGLILYSIVGFVVGIIIAKKFFGAGGGSPKTINRGGGQLSPDIIKVPKILEDQNDLYRKMIKTINTDIGDIKGSIKTLQLHVKKIEDLLYSSVKEGITFRDSSISESKIKKGVEHPSPKRTLTLHDFLEAYNSVNAEDLTKVNKFLTDWQCEKIEMRSAQQLGEPVSFVKSKREDFLLVNSNNFTYIVPYLFKSVSTDRQLVLERCFKIEPEIKKEGKYSVIEPATMSRLPDGSFRLEKKGKIQILKAPIREQATQE